MLAQEYIEKALASCQRALDDLEKGNKRQAVGDIDFIRERIEAAKWILINEIKDEEGKF